MIDRIKGKIEREKVKRYRKNVPFQKQTTFADANNNWYDPLLAGPSSFVEDCCSHQTVTGVLGILEKLTPEKYLEFNIEYYRQGLQRFGEKWRYADILTVLYGICINVKIESYLEIGVRRGRSMSVVASLNPDSIITGFDMWMPDYVGVENPGPDFVKNELKKVGYRGEPVFVNGNSIKTLPKYFIDHPGEFFDLITVDGGHAAAVAISDLKNVIPRIKIGGFLVFDDICNIWHTDLRNVWKKVVKKTGRFATYEFEELGYGVAFAIKKY